MPIGRIETAAIKRWITEMTAEGLSASRIRHCYQLLAAILASAVAEQRLGRTPCVGIKLPRLPKREMRILTPEQVAALADAIDPRYAALVYTLAGTGLRWGEAAALRRGRCKLLAGQLEITESLAELPELVFGAPKNHQRRTVAVPGFLRDILAAHIAQHSAPDLTDLVFTSPNGTPLRHSNVRKAWLATTAKIGLEGVTPHDLRHTCASQLIAAGVPITEVAAQLGHKDPSITLRVYAHLYDRNFQAVADALDATYRREAQTHGDAQSNAGRRPRGFQQPRREPRQLAVKLASALDRELRDPLPFEEVVMQGHRHVEEREALGQPELIVRREVHVVDELVVLAQQAELGGVQPHRACCRSSSTGRTGTTVRTGCA